MGCKVVPNTCGTPGSVDRSCAIECYPGCDTLGDVQLTQLYLDRRNRFTSDPAKARETKARDLPRIRTFEWAGFYGNNGICWNGVSFFLFRRNTLQPPQQSSAGSAGEEQGALTVQGALAMTGRAFEAFGRPFGRAFESIKQGDFQGAKDQLDTEHVAAAAAAGLLALSVVIGIGKKIFGRKKTPEPPRERQPRPREPVARPSVLRDPTVPFEFKQRPAPEMVEIPVPLALQPVEHPIPLVPERRTPVPAAPTLSPPAEQAIVVEPESESARRRQLPEADPTPVDEVNARNSAIDFDTIEAAQAIYSKEGRERHVQRIEALFHGRLPLSMVKKAALLARAYLYDGDVPLLEPTLGLLEHAASSAKGGEITTEDLRNALETYAEQSIPEEVVDGIFYTNRSWIESLKIRTKGYDAWLSEKGLRVQTPRSGTPTADASKPALAPAAAASPASDPRSMTADLGDVPSQILVEAERHKTSYLTMGDDASGSVVLSSGTFGAARITPDAERSIMLGVFDDIQNPRGLPDVYFEAARVEAQKAASRSFSRQNAAFWDELADAFVVLLREAGPQDRVRYFKNGKVSEEGLQAAARKATQLSQEPAYRYQRVLEDISEAMENDPRFKGLVPERREQLARRIANEAVSDSRALRMIYPDASGKKISSSGLYELNQELDQRSSRPATAVEFDKPERAEGWDLDRELDRAFDERVLDPKKGGHGK